MNELIPFEKKTEPLSLHGEEKGEVALAVVIT